MDSVENEPTRPNGWPRRLLRIVKRVCLWSLLLLVGYFLIALVGLIPVNNSFREPATDGVEIFVSSSAIHADLILPIRHASGTLASSEQLGDQPDAAIIDWSETFESRHFAGDVKRATHVAIGWGDRGFFLNTPEWSDLTVGTFCRAMFWRSGTCMHVTMGKKPKVGGSVRRVLISQQQYAELVAFINASFRLDEQRPIPIDGFAYWKNDAFFEAHGSYHCFNTCNSWTGRAMNKAGIRTPWMTPLPKTMFLYLPVQPSGD